MKAKIPAFKLRMYIPMQVHIIIDTMGVKPAEDVTFY